MKNKYRIDIKPIFGTGTNVDFWRFDVWVERNKYDEHITWGNGLTREKALENAKEKIKKNEDLIAEREYRKRFTRENSVTEYV